MRVSAGDRPPLSWRFLLVLGATSLLVRLAVVLLVRDIHGERG
jgi:hypothetical protein